MAPPIGSKEYIIARLTTPGGIPDGILSVLYAEGENGATSSHQLRHRTVRDSRTHSCKIKRRGNFVFKIWRSTGAESQKQYSVQLYRYPVHRPGPIPVVAERFLKTRSTCTLIGDLVFEICIRRDEPLDPLQ